MLKKLILSCCVLFFAFAFPAYSASKDYYDTTTDSQKIGWMLKGMKAIKAKLKDPESAEFRRVFFTLGTENIPMTCGQVNAKNSFGGYAGFQRFMSAGREDLSFLESDVSDFEIIWAQMCN